MHLEQWKDCLLQALQEKKAVQERVLKVDTLLAEYFIVASALSSRHLWTLAAAIEEVCKKHKQSTLVHGKSEDTRWIVVDTGGILVHLFLPESRTYYQLEELWDQRKLGQDDSSTRDELMHDTLM